MHACMHTQELSALYTIADVLVITPIRDGMNIVPFEYVVSRESWGLPATVVLSEFAGCARYAIYYGEGGAIQLCTLISKIRSVRGVGKDRKMTVSRGRQREGSAFSISCIGCGSTRRWVWIYHYYTVIQDSRKCSGTELLIFRESFAEGVLKDSGGCLHIMPT